MFFFIIYLLLSHNNIDYWLMLDFTYKDKKEGELYNSSLGREGVFRLGYII